MFSASSDDLMNGGTVSMCVEKTIAGDSVVLAYTSKRFFSTGIFVVWNPRALISLKRRSPTAPSFPLIDSMSTSCRVNANTSMGRGYYAGGEAAGCVGILNRSDDQHRLGNQIVFSRRPRGAAGGLAQSGQRQCHSQRGGLPSASAIWRYHAYQGGFSHHEGAERFWISRAALQFPRCGTERGGTR